MKRILNGTRFHATDPQTVLACICKSCGEFKEECPYAITGRLDSVFAEKEPVDNLEEGSSDMVI